MARRHDSLIPLARDHYDGLLLAVRLQQGTRALERLWSHDPLWQADYIVKFYEEHLRQHFRAEEEALFPLAAAHVEEARTIVNELLSQHRLMEEYVHRFRSPDPETLESHLREFGKLLVGHIRKEDRGLFPLFEEKASPSVLADAEKSISEFYPSSANPLMKH